MKPVKTSTKKKPKKTNVKNTSSKVTSKMAVAKDTKKIQLLEKDNVISSLKEKQPQCSNSILRDWLIWEYLLDSDVHDTSWETKTVSKVEKDTIWNIVHVSMSILIFILLYFAFFHSTTSEFLKIVVTSFAISSIILNIIFLWITFYREEQMLTSENYLHFRKEALKWGSRPKYINILQLLIMFMMSCTLLFFWHLILWAVLFFFIGFTYTVRENVYIKILEKTK